MATVNLGRVMFQTKGAWAGSTSYVVDDIVTFNGSSFICKLDHTSTTANQPLQTTNSQLSDQYWDFFQEGFSWRGVWATATVYYPNDVVRFGKTSYICRKLHTSSTNIKDPWYNPENLWDDFVQGGVGAAKNRVTMLGKRGPVGWNGHPFITKPTWTAGTGGTGGGTWNGNIPWNIPAAAKRWEWNNSDGQSRVNMLRNQRFVDATGKWNGMGNGGDYSYGQANDARSAAFQMDPSWMRDYWNNTNTTSGYKGKDYKTDTNSGMPSVVQSCTGYYSDLVLYSNGTVVRHGYGGTGQGSLNSNDSTIYGSNQINFPPGTFIVKIAYGNPTGTDDNTHCLALDSEGNIWAWGNNYYGQLGIGSEPSQSKVVGELQNTNYRDYENTPKRIPVWAFDGKRIVDIWAFGRYVGSSYALDEAGVLWSWGYNGVGALGYPTNTGFRYTDGSTVPLQWGRATSHDWNTYGGIQKIMINSEDHPSSGYSTVYILDGQGYVWVCGYNASYMWGNNSTTASTSNSGTPLRLDLSANSSGLNGAVQNLWIGGSDNACNVFVRKNDGTLWGWGINSHYQLTDGTTTSRNYPVQIAGVLNPLNVTCSGHENTGSGHWALTIDSNNRYRIMAGGNNPYGCLGFGETGGTHATSSSQGSGMFHRVFGTGQFAWQPVSFPAGKDRANAIRDMQMAGGGSEQMGQVLFEDGTIMNTGSNYYDGTNLNYNPIMPYNWGHANTLRRPTGTV